MKPRLNEMETSRRALLTALGVVGLTALGPAVDGPRSDAAQGRLADLGPEETVDATINASRFLGMITEATAPAEFFWEASCARYPE